MRTYSQKTADVSRQWYELDANGVPLGRLATQAAGLLIGKSKPQYTPHVDGGDYVIITNAANISLSGRKDQEFKYRHSGYPGGIKSISKGKLLKVNPQKLVTDAVVGMLPKNKLQTERIKRLKVYVESEHDHAAQKPQKLEVNYGR